MSFHNFLLNFFSNLLTIYACAVVVTCASKLKFKCFNVEQREQSLHVIVMVDVEVHTVYSHVTWYTCQVICFNYWCNDSTHDTARHKTGDNLRCDSAFIYGNWSEPETSWVDVTLFSPRLYFKILVWHEFVHRRSA